EGRAPVIPEGRRAGGEDEDRGPRRAPAPATPPGLGGQGGPPASPSLACGQKLAKQKMEWRPGWPVYFGRSQREERAWPTHSFSAPWTSSRRYRTKTGRSSPTACRSGASARAR